MSSIVNRRVREYGKYLGLLFCLVLLTGIAFGQNAIPVPEQPRLQTASCDSQCSATQEKAGANSQATKSSAADQERMFGVIPTHAITNDKNAPPLTPGGKFRVFLDNTTDPFILIGTGLQAGLSQATNEFPAYGQGAAGYGKRLGAAMADFSIGEFMGTFVFPSLLHEDPRYFREGSGSGGKRLGYALSSAVITRKDSGRRGFGWANILGRITAGAISNAYYPQEDRGVGLVFSRTAIGIGFGTAGAVFSEFGPDIQRKLFAKKKPGQSNASPGEK